MTVAKWPKKKRGKPLVQEVLPAHAYLSTACWHQTHHECRKVCKFCGAVCACPCHLLPVREHWEIRDEDIPF